MEADFYELFDTAVKLHPFISIVIGYSSVTGWTLDLYDRKRMYAEAYVGFTEWLSETYGGY